jgi:hypothetical protein
MLQTFFVNPADFTRISLQLSICLSVYLQEEEEVVVVMSLSAKGGGCYLLPPALGYSSGGCQLQAFVAKVFVFLVFVVI